MAIEKLRKNGKIIGYKVRLPALRGSKVSVTQNFMCRDFVDRAEAEDKAQNHQRTQKKLRKREQYGLEPDIELRKDFTVRHIILSYIGDRDNPDGFFNRFLPQTMSNELKAELLKNREEDVDLEELHVLWRFASRKIAEKDLLQFNHFEAEQYVKDRLKEPRRPGETRLINPNSVKREIKQIQKAWKHAEGFKELRLLPNPWAKVDVPGAGLSPPPCGLKDGELELLIESCKQSRHHNRYYIPLAIYLAIETGMRLQEILNLTWNNIDTDLKRITIKECKGDWAAIKRGQAPGGTIALPVFAELMLGELMGSLCYDGRLPPPDRIFMGKFEWSNPIFPMSVVTFKRAFSEVKKRANLEHITFRSTLRTTANTRFRAAKLDLEERELMLNHVNKTMNVKYEDKVAMYDHALPIIRTRLEKYAFEGMTEQSFSSLKNDLVRWTQAGLDGGWTRERAMEVAITQSIQLQFRASVLETIKTNPSS